MHSPTRLFLLLGSVNALIGVILGAFGAHGLKLWMAPDLFTVYQTAVEYQFFHALGYSVWACSHISFLCKPSSNGRVGSCLLESSYFPEACIPSA